MGSQATKGVEPQTVLSSAANLPSPALGPGQMRQGALVVSDDEPALYWVNGDGINVPRTLQKMGGGTIVAGPVDFYVNSATGSDTNPGTAAAPFLTIPRAQQAAALIRSTTGATTIHLQNVGNFVQPLDCVWTIPYMLSPEPPVRMVGPVLDSGSGTITATGGTTGGFVPAAGGTITGVFVAHAYKKKYGTWLPGAANVGEFPIIDNDAATITCDAAFAHAPLNGDTFTVGTPGAVVVITGTLTVVGAPLLQDTYAFDIPQTGSSALHSGTGLNFLNDYCQENRITYLGHAGATTAGVRLCNVLDSGISKWATAIAQPPCGCIYDGSLTVSTKLAVLSESAIAAFVNTLMDTCALTAGKGQSQGGRGFLFANIHYFNACSVGVTDGALFASLGGLYNACVTGQPINGIGPGCFAARNGSQLDMQFCDFEACGSAGAGLVSLDQSKGVFALFTGVNAAAKNVMEEHSQASCSVSSLTVTDVTGTTTGLVGGNAAAIVISGVLAATTDLLAAAPQLCLVGAPT